MRVLFRADGSGEIGSGHVMRCLTLAAALREQGAEVRFVARSHAGHLGGVIAQRGFPVVMLPWRGDGRIDGDLTHASWVGASWEGDADETRAVVDAAGGVDWLVVDHYGLDKRWERRMRPSAARLLVVDDLADRMHDCDLLLDQNLVAGMESRYDEKLPPNCGRLLGPGYALLDREFAGMHLAAIPRQGAIGRLFIFFGAADRGNLTGRCLDSFLRLGRSDIDVDVVVNDDSPHAASIHEQARSRSNVHVHSGLPTLAPLMAAADLAMGACGTAAWERLCVGLPTLVVTLAANQRPAAEELCAQGLIRLLGAEDEVSDELLREALRELIENGLDADWSQLCLATLDGKGTARVTAALTVTAATPLRVRRATLLDEATLLAWANDAVTRRGAFSSARIELDSHHRWYRERLSRRSSRIFVIETPASVAVGQVRFDRDTDNWTIDYTVAPELRGRGLGRRVLELALSQLAEEQPGASVVGRVKANNTPSCRVFEALGFGVTITDAYVEYHRVA